MPQVTGRLTNSRVLIKVGIIPFAPYADQSDNIVGFPIASHECMALVDTGARRTCVAETVAQRLNMRRVGRVEVWNVKRPELHWTYLFQVGIWPDPIAGTPSGFFGIGEPIEGIDVGNHPFFDVLLGMDIISQGKFVIEKDGEFSLDF